MIVNWMETSSADTYGITFKPNGNGLDGIELRIRRHHRHLETIATGGTAEFWFRLTPDDCANISNNNLGLPTTESRH